MKFKRTVVRIQWNAERKHWLAIVSGQVIGVGCMSGGRVAHKEALVRFLAKGCADHAELGYPTQLVIHSKNGRIQSERTYGADPKRRKG